MKLNIINSKTFFGTDSSEEASRISKFLTNLNIRCTCKTFYNYDTFKLYYHGDPYHVYSEAYLKNLPEFHIIRVHRFDYKKALEYYSDY